MFTGIIEEKGQVKAVTSRENLSVLKITTRKVFPGTKVGDSIAVNGVCLTVSRIEKPDCLVFELMQETLNKAALNELRPGSPVNLERALKINSRFGGHLVSGHIDGTGLIQKIIKKGQYVQFQISLDKHLRRFLVPQGSVCVDGVSLTVGKVGGNRFWVHLIPHTLKMTTLGDKIPFDRVNIETDLIAKYLLNKKSLTVMGRGIRIASPEKFPKDFP